MKNQGTMVLTRQNIKISGNFCLNYTDETSPFVQLKLIIEINLGLADYKPKFS